MQKIIYSTILLTSLFISAPISAMLLEDPGVEPVPESRKYKNYNNYNHNSYQPDSNNPFKPSFFNPYTTTAITTGVLVGLSTVTYGAHSAYSWLFNGKNEASEENDPWGEIGSDQEYKKDMLEKINGNEDPSTNYMANLDKRYEEARERHERRKMEKESRESFMSAKGEGKGRVGQYASSTEEISCERSEEHPNERQEEIDSIYINSKRHIEEMLLFSENVS